MCPKDAPDYWMRGQRIEYIDLINIIKLIEEIGKISVIDKIGVLGTIEKVEDLKLADLTKSVGWKPFSVSFTAAGDQAVWTPSAGYRIRLMGLQFSTDADVQVGLRFGTVEDPSWVLQRAGSLPFNLLGCNRVGDVDQPIYVRAEGVVNVKGVLLGEEEKVLTVYTKTYRPNADEHTEWSNTLGEHYLEVDEETADEDSTYVYLPAAVTEWKDELFRFTHDIPADAKIYWVKVFWRCRGVHDVYTGSSRAALRVEGVNYYGEIFSNLSEYVTRSYRWGKNPATNADWIPADLDTLAFGFSGVTGLDPETLKRYEIRCTQTYIQVQYGV